MQVLLSITRLFLTLIIANLLFLSHAVADESISPNTAKIWKDARRLASSWHSGDINLMVQDSETVSVSPGGPIIIGKNFLSLTSTDDAGDSMLMFALLHELWHLNQAKNTPLEYFDIQSRPAMECAADAHAALTMTQDFLSELNATTTDEHVESVIQRIEHIREIPKKLPTLNPLDAEKYHHLNLKQRELAVLFGIMGAYNTLSSETTPSSKSIQRLIEMASSFANSFSSDDSKSITDVCAHIVAKETSAGNSLRFLPLELKSYKYGSHSILSTKYEVSNSGSRPIKYSYLIFEGYVPKGKSDSPSSYFIKGVHRAKIMIPAGGTVGLLAETPMPNIDNSKFEPLINSPATIPLAEFAGPSEFEKNCFGNTIVPSNTDMEKQLKTAIIIGSAALENFEAVKGILNGIGNAKYNFDLPPNTNGYIKMSDSFIVGSFAVFNIYSGNDRDEALAVFEHMVALVEKRCKKTAGFESPFKKTESPNPSLAINQFTVGSSATLDLIEPDPNEVDDMDMPITVSWTISRRAVD